MKQHMKKDLNQSRCVGIRRSSVSILAPFDRTSANHLLRGRSWIRAIRGVTMVISGLLLLLASHPAYAAGLNLHIQTPDAELMMPPVSPPQFQKEGLPLSWEDSNLKDFIGFLERREYEEALACFREKEGTAKGFSFLDFIEIGDPGGQLKERAATGGVGQVGAATGFLQDLNKMGQISAHMLYMIGHTYFSLEKYQAAETAFLTALTPMPDFIRVHESLGLLYLRMERYEDARKHLARAAELGLHTAELYGATGYLHCRTGNFWSAASAFQKSLMLKPDNGQWKRGLLQALSKTYRYQDTLALAGSLLKEHPDDAGLWLFRAKAALQAGEKEKALSSLETAIRLGDNNSSNRQVCAVLHMELGSIERAMDLLKSGFTESMDFMLIDQGMSQLEQVEEWALLERMLGSVRGKWGDLDDPQRSRVLIREAGISLHNGNMSAAGDNLEQAIALDPSNAIALISLADIHRGKGNYNRAELLYRRAGAYDLYRERALISMAQLAMDQDDFERALQMLRETLKEFPDRTDLNRNIESLGNLVLLQTGQPREGGRSRE